MSKISAANAAWKGNAFWARVAYHKDNGMTEGLAKLTAYWEGFKADAND
jgi:hypothetical protein